MIRILLAVGLVLLTIAAANAFGLGLGDRFGKLGAFPNRNGGSGPTGPCGNLLLEDGSSFLLLEDGTSQLLLESPCALTNLRITNTGAFRITNTGANRAVFP